MKKSLAFLIVFFFFLTLVEKSDSQKCRSHRAPKGNCRRPKHCPPLFHLSLFQDIGDLTAANAGSNCTADELGNHRICCPIIPVPCTSPLGQASTCETVADCPEFRLQSDLAFSEFDRVYGECPPDGEGTNRWCCPSPTDNCKTSDGTTGQCRLFKDCPAVQPLINVLSASKILDAYGGCGRGSDGSVRICCPS